MDMEGDTLFAFSLVLFQGGELMKITAGKTTTRLDAAAALLYAYELSQSAQSMIRFTLSRRIKDFRHVAFTPRLGKAATRSVKR